jgi:hypothetical protein
MTTPARVLLAAAGAIYLSLGGLHLVYTFFSRKFDPYEESLKARLQETTLQLTRKTTFWKAWIGFNASHSTGALFFGFVLCYSAVTVQTITPAFQVLAGVCLVNSAFYVWLARKYWFRIPWLGSFLATISLAISFALSLMPTNQP